MTGTIARIVSDRGFGFIKPSDGGDDVFFHARSLEEGLFDSLKEGENVVFDLENGPKGPAAVNVVRAEGGDAPASADEAPTDEAGA